MVLYVALEAAIPILQYSAKRGRECLKGDKLAARQQALLLLHALLIYY